MMLHSQSRWLVNGLMLRELFFQISDKTGNFAVLMICCAVPVPVPVNQYISTPKWNHLYFRFSAELNEPTHNF